MDHGIVIVVVVPSQSMDILEDRYFIFARKLLSFCGIWYTQTFKERVIRNYIIICMLYVTLIQLCQFLTMDFNLRSAVLIFQTFIPAVCTTQIYYTFVLNFIMVTHICSWIVQDYQQIKDEVELKIMKEYVNQTKLFAVICGLLFFLFVSFALFPFLLQITVPISGTVENKYPGRMFACLNHFSKIEHYYYPVMICEILTTFLLTTIAMLCYSLYFWFIQHACARLTVIKSKIHQLFENDQHKDHIREKPLNLTKKTVDIIQRLSRTRDFMSLVNHLGEQCYLFQILLAFLLVLLDFLCMFQMPTLLQDKETKKDAVAFVVFILYTITPLYLNCFVGQRLMNYSIDVYEEMCLIPIHNVTLKTQKLMLITIIMNSKPCAISIGKMFMSSHEFFSDLLRLAFSFAITLHSTQHA